MTNIMVDEPWYASIAYNLLNGRGMVDVVGGYRWISLYLLLMVNFIKFSATTLVVTRLFRVLGSLIGPIGFASTF